MRLLQRKYFPLLGVRISSYSVDTVFVKLKQLPQYQFEKCHYISHVPSKHLEAYSHSQTSSRLLYYTSKNGSISPSQISQSRNFSTSRIHAESEHVTVSTSLLFPDFPTIKASESALQFIHNLTGLPWWSTIILTAFFMRMVLPLPLAAYSMHNAVRLHKLEPEIKDIAVQLKGEVSRAVRQFEWDQPKARREYIKNMKRHVRKLYIRDNCHPMKDAATFWLHIPLWLSMSYALRNMASRAMDSSFDNHAVCEPLSREGMAWFVDLTQTDSTWILPLMLGTITLCNFELNRSRVSVMTTYHRALTIALRIMAILFIPISAAMPSALVLYWVSSGLFATIQSLFIVRSSWFKRLICLPPLPKKTES